MTCQDYQVLIDTPGENVLLYIDPPYVTKTRLYGREGRLHVFDHKRLAESLRTTSHKFLLTYDNCETVRDLYKWANQHVIDVKYSMSETIRPDATELVITNY